MVIQKDQERQDETIIKDARSKLSHVLANIRSGKIEEEYDYDEGDENDQEFPSPPQKRRHTTNYVALSGIQRRTRSTDDSHAKNAASKSFCAVPTTSTPQTNATARPSTFILKLFDRTVDLAQFSHAEANEDAPLYPVCRAWVHSQQVNQDPRMSRNKLLVYPQNQEANQSSGGVGTIYRLPKPLDNKSVLIQDGQEVPDDCDKINLRIPKSVRDWKKDLDGVKETLDNLFDVKDGDSMTGEERLRENCERWRAVRNQWKASAKLNERRFDESGQMLRDIYLTNTIKHQEM